MLRLIRLFFQICQPVGFCHLMHYVTTAHFRDSFNSRRIKYCVPMRIKALCNTFFITNYLHFTIIVVKSGTGCTVTSWLDIRPSRTTYEWWTKSVTLNRKGCLLLLLCLFCYNWKVQKNVGAVLFAFRNLLWSASIGFVYCQEEENNLHFQFLTFLPGWCYRGRSLTLILISDLVKSNQQLFTSNLF